MTHAPSRPPTRAPAAAAARPAGSSAGSGSAAAARRRSRGRCYSAGSYRSAARLGLGSRPSTARSRSTVTTRDEPQVARSRDERTSVESAAASATVPPMLPPATSARERAAGASSASGAPPPVSPSSSRRRRRARHAAPVRIRRLGQRAVRGARARERGAAAPGRAAAPEIVARLGALHLQLPVSQCARDRDRLPGRRRRRARARAARRAGERGAAAARRARDLRQLDGGAALVPAARRRRARRRRRSTSAPQPGTDVYSPVDGTVVAIARRRARRQRLRLARSTSSRRRAVARRLGLARQRRPGARPSARRSPSGGVAGSARRRLLARRAPGARALHERRGQPRRDRGAPGRDPAPRLEPAPCGSSSSPTCSARRAGGRSRSGCPSLREELGVDFCIVNGENAADGPRDHARSSPTSCSPAAPTWSRSATGRGASRTSRRTSSRHRPRAPAGEHVAAHAGPRPRGRTTAVAVINLLGMFSLDPFESPFIAADQLVEEARRETPVDRRRLPRRGDEREGRARALPRRPRDRGARHAHARPDERRARPRRAARRRSPTRA